MRAYYDVPNDQPSSVVSSAPQMEEIEETEKIVSLEDFCVEKLSESQLMIRLKGTSKKWIVTSERYTIQGDVRHRTEFNIMETNGVIVDDSMYSYTIFDGKTKFGTLYSFYYKSMYEFTGHLLHLADKRITHKYREGNTYKSWGFASDDPDGYAFHGRNVYSVSTETYKTINPQLDWFEHGHRYIMYDDRLKMTREFREYDGDGRIPDIDEADIPEEEHDILMSMAMDYPQNVYDVLPKSERQYFIEIAKIANEYFGQK